jgi:cellulose synthase/poly-beta-1,6-N-acetylglucosamine synthase-like glycosyltransferase
MIVTISEDRKASSNEETRYVSVAVMIPAHNEEAGIEAAITSVFNQDFRSFDASLQIELDVLVIADNCVDATVAIVKRLQERYPNLYVTETVNNVHRKAGALNWGFQWFCEHGRREAYSYTFSMDADTVLDVQILAMGLKTIQPEDGGICCRVGLLPLEKKPSLWQKLWWSIQNIEYGIAQSETVERFEWARVLCGPATLFRTSVLKELQEKNQGEIWRGDTLVEDKVLTTEIQQLHYPTRVGHGMFAYTDAPVGFDNHLKQRKRWYGGNLHTFFMVGMNRHTLPEIGEMAFQILLFACRIDLILTAVHILLTGFLYVDMLTFWLLWLPVVTVLINLDRFRYVSYKTAFQLFLVVFFVYELYALWFGVILVVSFYTAYSRKLRW